jgi:hypothetical protein
MKLNGPIGPDLAAVAITSAEGDALALHPEAVAVNVITVAQILLPNGTLAYWINQSEGLTPDIAVGIARRLVTVSDNLDREAQS